MRPEGALPNKIVKPEAPGTPPKKPFSWKYLALAVLFGIVFTFLFHWFEELAGLSPRTANRRIWLVLAVFFVLMILLSLWARRRNRFTREANALLPLLESDPDAYIAGYEEMRTCWKGAFYQGYICINLVAGYFGREDYAAAERLLREAATYGLPGRARTVWASDLAMCAFRQERWEDGLAIMEREKAAMEDLAASQDAGLSSWVLLCLYRLVAQGKREEAVEALAKSEERWRTSRTEKTFDHLHQLLDEN